MEQKETTIFKVSSVSLSPNFPLFLFVCLFVCLLVCWSASVSVIIRNANKTRLRRLHFSRFGFLQIWVFLGRSLTLDLAFLDSFLVAWVVAVVVVVVGGGGGEGAGLGGRGAAGAAP